MYFSLSRRSIIILYCFSTFADPALSVLSRHNVDQRLAPHKPVYLLADQAKGALYESVAIPGDMGRNQQIGCLPQGMPFGRGSGSVTSRAARTLFSLSACSSASVSTIGPLDAFTSSAPGFILARRLASNR
jgi:hypothetical protein